MSDAEAAALLTISRDRTPIACWRRGAGPPLLLVHGSGEDHTRWRRVGGALGERFTVYAMDRRGRGASGDARVHSLAAEADDVAAVLRLIGEPAHLLGHSYGALCCLEAAAGGAPVGRLVLHEPCLPFAANRSHSELAGRLHALLEAGDREAVVTTFLREAVGVSTRYISVLRALPIYPTLMTSAHTLLRELTATERYELDAGRLRRIEAEVLLLVGDKLDSPFLSVALGAIRQAIPDAELAVLPGHPHMALDVAPMRVVAAVSDFLSRPVGIDSRP